MCGTCGKKRTYAGVTSNVPRPNPLGQTTPDQSKVTQESQDNAISNANTPTK